MAPDALAREVGFCDARAAPPGQTELRQKYSRAIELSARGTLVPHELEPVSADSRFVTWARCGADFQANQKCGRYQRGQSVELKDEVWVTANEEVRKRCRGFTGDPSPRLQQLLGLMPASADPPPATDRRQFVTFESVPIDRVFRPCTDPDVRSTRCTRSTPPGLPADGDHRAWLSNQASSAWRVPRDIAGELPCGFPWTGLGYTYDWSSNAAAPYGASEYVIKGQVSLQVSSVETTEDFCAAAGGSPVAASGGRG